MSHIDGETTFTLQNPVQYSKDGNFEHGQVVTLLEPNSTKRKQCMRMRKIVKGGELDVASKFAALFKDQVPTRKEALHKQDEEEVNSSFESQKKAIESSLDASSDEDAIDKFAECFAQMLESSGQPIAFIADGVPMRRSHFEAIGMFDQVELAVTFAAFFGIASDKAQRGKSGENSVLPMPPKAL